MASYVKERNLRSWQVTAILVALLIVTTLVAPFGMKYAYAIAALGEWQFANLGSYFPALTWSAHLVVIAAVASFLFYLKNRRSTQTRAQNFPEDASQSQISLQRLRRQIKGTSLFFSLLSIFLIGSALGVLLVLLWQIKGNSEDVAISSNGAIAVNGPAHYDFGVIGRVTRLRHSAVFFQQEAFIAPVQFDDGAGKPIRFFTEVSLQWDHFVPVSSGYFVDGGVPGEIVSLYRRNGILVDNAPSLLISDKNALLRPALSKAGLYAIEALIALLAFWLLRKQEKRITLNLPYA